MRRPRNRRFARKSRPYTKAVYAAMARRIQRRFREFCSARYRPVCSNYNDTDYISMNPVGSIPRDLLFVCDNTGFDAREMFTWMLQSNVHPISRAVFTHPQREQCAQHLRRFVSNNRKRQVGKKGFFSRHRSVLNALGAHARSSKGSRG